MSTGGAKNKRTGEFEFHEQKPVSVGRNRDKKVVALCGTLVILLVFAVIQVGIMYMAYRSEANAKNTLQAEINRYEKIVGKDKLEEIEKYLSSRDASDEMQLSYVYRVGNAKWDNFTPESLGEDAFGLKYQQLIHMAERHTEGSFYQVSQLDCSRNGRNGYMAVVNYHQSRHYIVSYVESGDFMMDLYAPEQTKKIYYYRIDENDDWRRANYNSDDPTRCDELSEEERSALTGFNLLCLNSNNENQTF